VLAPAAHSHFGGQARLTLSHPAWCRKGRLTLRCPSQRLVASSPPGHPTALAPAAPCSSTSMVAPCRAETVGDTAVADHRLASRSSRSERRLVARGGFEPPKPLGRQIYSLLRLTAPQPRQLSSSAAAPRQTRCSVHEYQDAQLFRGNRLSRRLPAESRTRSDWSWRRDLNPRPADYKSAALPG
jgi:hypothetical protein